MVEIKEESKELAVLTEEEQQIKRWFDRMKMYPVPLPNPIRYMAARMAVAYGLDPFLGEMVFIPQYEGGELKGYQPYVGIGGVRRAARRTGEYGGRELRPCSEEERKALGVTKDQHAWFCQVWRNSVPKPFDGYGVFPTHDKDKSKAPPWRMARKRAEHDALRAAFDLELLLIEEEGVAIAEEKPVEKVDIVEGIIIEESIDAAGSEEIPPDEGLRQEMSLPGETPKPQVKHWIEYEKSRKAFWLWAHETLGLTDDDTHKALGVESVKDFQGSMAEAKKTIEEWLASQIDETKEE